jgi:4'-phosphopantetheinyl transferase
MIEPSPWGLDLTEAGERAEVYFSVLDLKTGLAPTSRDLCEAPSREPSRSQFLARRAFVREVVASKLGVAASAVTIGHDKSGAPMIVAPESRAHISTAGRENFCAIGIAQCAIGVDMEPLEPVLAPAENILHERERAGLAALEGVAKHEAFLRLWCAKEAYLKALGAGLSREPSQIEIVPADEAFTVRDEGRTPSLAAAQWRRIELHGRDFLAACVVLSGC